MNLPKHIFENPGGEEQVANESEVFYLVERTDFDKGIHTWLKGAEYPQKGMAPAETLFYFNMAKRILAESLKLGSKMPVMLGFMLGQAVLPKRHKLSTTGILATYNSILWKVLSPYILKGEYMTAHAYEVRKFLYVFLREIGVDEHVARQFSSIVSHFLEYDNAYRFRVQDLLHDSSAKALTENPFNEIKRFMLLSRERDSKAVSDKLVSGLRILSLALRIPKYRRAFNEALTFIEFDKLKFDDIDIYWISMRNDYDYLGEDVTTRAKRNEGKSIPIPMPKDEYEQYVGKLQRDNNEVMILKSIDVLLANKKYRKLISNKLKK